MKSKATLSLMEQIVMLLVFALAAAVCLRVFVLSGNLSRQGEIRGNAITAVQNAAESVKLCGGDLEQHALLAGGKVEKGNWYQHFDEQWQAVENAAGAAYLLGVTPETTDDPLLGSALVWAHDADGNPIFQVTVCWQEENDG